MSYLQLKSGSGPTGKKAIWSFWVNVSAFLENDHSWPDELIPPHINEIMSANERCIVGGSYHGVFPEFIPPRIEIYPAKDKHTYLHGMVPFITWGDPQQENAPTLPVSPPAPGDPPPPPPPPPPVGKYNLVKWEKITIEEKYFFFEPGSVGNYKLVAQFPNQDTKPTFDIVPPSMIGCKDGKLRIILQTTGRAKYTGYCWAQEKAKLVKVLTPIGNPDPATELAGGGLPNVFAWLDFNIGGFGGSPNPNPAYRGEAFWYKDVSSLECHQHPEAFILEPDVEINDGKWHHILFSYDLTGEGPDALPVAGSGETSTQPSPPDPPPGGIQPGNGDSGGENYLIVAEATGPDGKPPYPGPYGQWSGPFGEFVVTPGFLWPEPRENVGKYGLANGGTLKSKCKAWLMVDGKPYTGKDLNHRDAWEDLKRKDGGLAALRGLDPNSIAPPNAFLAPCTEIRESLTTSTTGWERIYRTLIGGVVGPAAKIDQTGEPRRLDYARPKYEFNPPGLSSGPLAMPAGVAFPKLNDSKIRMAELHVWNGKCADVGTIYNLFSVRFGPVLDIEAMDKAIGSKPTIRLHWATNWIGGFNNGSAASRQTGPGSGTDGQTVQKPEGAFAVVGDIERYSPDP